MKASDPCKIQVLIRTKRANLSKSMQWLGATYTKRFNLRHFRSGHLFQGRFKNMLAQNDAYLLQLSYYIHRNPARAGMVKRLSSYKWSSYRSYAYDDHANKWLHTELLLAQFLNVADRHLAYREAVQRYSKEEQRVWENLRLYLIWHTGQLTNLQIAEKSGLTYLAVSRMVGVFRDLLRKSKTLQNKFNRVKSLIKI